MTDITETVTLKETKQNTILLGFVLGTARVNGIDIEISGAGKIVRFRAKWIEKDGTAWTREYDLDLRSLAASVIDECEKLGGDRIDRS